MIKIQSDGTPGNTRVYQEDGTEIKEIKSITWTISAEDNKLAQATLTFDGVLVDVEGEV